MTLRSFLNGVLLLALVFLLSGTTGDPDLWGHVRFGQDMLQQGTIRIADTYSFTSDQAWTNHEWLAEIAMATSFDLMGPAGLNALRLAIIVCVLGLAWRATRLCTPRCRVLLVGAAALGMLLRAHPIRPQLLSLLLFALLLTVLAHFEQRRSWKSLGLAPVVMAVWVNCHGGWIVGLAALGLWTILTGITASRRERLALAGTLVASAAATLVNPYGFGLWRFIADTVRVERPMISDWLPMYRLPYALWVPWITAAAVTAIAATRATSRTSQKYFAIATVLGLITIRVSRLDAFFAIAAMFFAAQALSGSNTQEPPKQLPERRSPVLATSFVFAAAALSFVIVPRVAAIPVAPGSVPDAAVVSFVKDQRLVGNVLTWFDWGEFTIWHFGRHLKVSMDGRRETVYSSTLVDAHLRFYSGEPGAWAFADQLQSDYVWLPKRLKVVPELQQHGWFTLCEGTSSILLTRRPTTTRCMPPEQTAAKRLFPEI